MDKVRAFCAIVRNKQDPSKLAVGGVAVHGCEARDPHVDIKVLAQLLERVLNAVIQHGGKGKVVVAASEDLGVTVDLQYYQMVSLPGSHRRRIRRGCEAFAKTPFVNTKKYRPAIFTLELIVT